MTIYRATISGNCYGNLFQNVLHFWQGDSVPLTAAPALCVSIRDVWLPQQRQFSQSCWIYTQVKVDELIAGGTGVQSTLPINIAGSQGTETRAALGLAMVLQFGTGLGGRRNRGRLFVPSASSGSLQGLWDSTVMTARQTQINALKAAYVGPNQTQPFSLVLHGPHDDHTTFRLVSTIALRATPGSQRRRMVGVGA